SSGFIGFRIKPLRLDFDHIQSGKVPRIIYSISGNGSNGLIYEYGGYEFGQAEIGLKEVVKHRYDMGEIRGEERLEINSSRFRLALDAESTSHCLRCDRRPGRESGQTLSGRGAGLRQTAGREGDLVSVLELGPQRAVPEAEAKEEGREHKERGPGTDQWVPGKHSDQGVLRLLGPGADWSEVPGGGHGVPEPSFDAGDPGQRLSLGDLCPVHAHHLEDQLYARDVQLTRARLCKVDTDRVQTSLQDWRPEGRRGVREESAARRTPGQPHGPQDPGSAEERRRPDGGAGAPIQEQVPFGAGVRSPERAGGDQLLQQQQHQQRPLQSQSLQGLAGLGLARELHAADQETGGRAPGPEQRRRVLSQRQRGDQHQVATLQVPGPVSLEWGLTGWTGCTEGLDCPKSLCDGHPAGRPARPEPPGLEVHQVPHRPGAEGVHLQAADHRGPVQQHPQLHPQVHLKPQADRPRPSQQHLRLPEVPGPQGVLLRPGPGAGLGPAGPLLLGHPRGGGRLPGLLLLGPVPQGLLGEEAAQSRQARDPLLAGLLGRMRANHPVPPQVRARRQQRQESPQLSEPGLTLCWMPWNRGRGVVHAGGGAVLRPRGEEGRASLPDRADGLHPQRQRPGGLHPHGSLRLGRQHPRHAGQHELPPCCGLWPSGHRPAPFLQGRQPLHHEPL
ncbi:hypothetical protein OJ252_3313, partial [Cryptosporidium canis]